MTLQDDLIAASDASTSVDELIRLASSSSIDVRRAVARNMAAPKEALAMLLAEFLVDVWDNPARTLFDLDEKGPLGWVPAKVKVALLQACMRGEP